MEFNQDYIIVDKTSLVEVSKGIKALTCVDGSMVERLNINNGVIDESYLQHCENGGVENEAAKEEEKGFKEVHKEGKKEKVEKVSALDALDELENE